MVSDEMISTKDCAHQVQAIGKMFGLLYYHFARVLVKELGEEEGKKLILKAVSNYGHERGQKIKEEVQKHGLELTVENFSKFSDLPSLGWGFNEGNLVHCPYAQPWIEKGEQELGILYCEVDLAKYKAYNPNIKIERLKSILTGHDCCEYHIE